MSNGITINLGFDAASIARARRMADFESWLAALYQTEAMPRSLDELEQAAQASMLASFKNPTGNVETKFRKYVRTPWRGILGNYEPYARRLNYGFSGKTDSLGRYYSFWPDYHWAEGAIEMATPYVQAHFRESVQQAIDEVSR